MKTLEIINIISQYKNSVLGIVIDKEECYRQKEYINYINKKVDDGIS